MEKINIAELLKDCPTGMELDCTMYNKVTLLSVDDRKNIIFPIKVIREDGNSILLTKYGQYTYEDFAKCVIFPKGKTTWEGFQRPFKDGDILATDLGSVFYLNTHLNADGHYGCYVGIGGDGSFHICVPFAYKECCRFATEKEKQKLFDAIKANGYRWNDETKTLENLPKFKVGDRIKEGKTIATVVGVCKYVYDIRFDSGGIGAFSINLQDRWELVPNKFDITTLKPFDKVLVRDNINEKWNIRFFSYIDDAKMFKTIMGTYIQCVPYKGNEHLLGTTNDCDDFYKY